MGISAGTEVYNADFPPVKARGVGLSKAELAHALQTDVAEIVSDYKGNLNYSSYLPDLRQLALSRRELRRSLILPALLTIGELAKASLKHM